MKTFSTRSTAETEALAERLARSVRPGEVWCLRGDLGVGKTAFARGFARGLAVSREVTSPTFTLVHEYACVFGDGTKGRFCHFDIYRLGSEDELYEIGWDEYSADGSVCLVEWADQLRGAMPADAVWVTIEKELAEGTEFRWITVEQPDRGGEDMNLDAGNADRNAEIAGEEERA